MRADVIDKPLGHDKTDRADDIDRLLIQYRPVAAVVSCILAGDVAEVEFYEDGSIKRAVLNGGMAIRTMMATEPPGPTT